MNFRFIIFVCFVLFGFLALFFIFCYKKDDKHEFLYFIKKVGLYSLPVVLVVSIYLFAGKEYRKILNGISMSKQLEQGFYNAVANKKGMYILGNSRCYRGLNPKLLGLSTYNFAYDNETFLEQYYKLEYLKKNGIIPDTVILGVDYFEFSFVSTVLKDVYSQYFSPDYIKSIDKYVVKSNNKLDDLNNFMNSRMSTLFGRSASQYFDFLYYHYILGDSIQFPYLKDNGQYIIRPLPHAKEGDFVKRDSTILEIQEKSFESIISFTKIHNITLFLVMPPTRKIERDSYSIEFVKKRDEYFISKCEEGNIFYISYFNDNDFITTDFMDDTHLTPIAADRFSRKLRMDIEFLNGNKRLLYLYH